MKKKLLIVVGVLLWFSVNLLMRRCEDEGISNTSNQMYPIIERKDSIAGIISSVYNPPKTRTTETFVRLELKDGRKLSVGTDDHSLESEDVYFRDLCLDGSVVEKEPHSDTVFVKFQGEIFTFLLYKDE